MHGIWAFGYIAFQLPGGWLGDRFGRRAMLPVYGIAWSLCTLWTATTVSFSGLWWSRSDLRRAQAGLVPCLTRACLDWFPEDRRGSAECRDHGRHVGRRGGRQRPGRIPRPLAGLAAHVRAVRLRGVPLGDRVLADVP